jgi:hypothetical protein
MAQPDQIAEIRLYIVVSEEFDALQLPGVAPAAPAGGGDAPPYKNTDAYVKAFRPNDYLQFVAAHQSQIEAAEQARIFALRDKDAQTRAYNDQRKSWEDRRAESDPGRAPGFQLGLGSHQWFSYGLLGSPLRRGDFQRIGSTEGRNWSTITGVIIYMRTNIKGVTAIAFGDAFLTGGAGPDTTEPGVQAYDYRCTHYDTRTGAESNGSDVQGEVRTDPQSVTFELAPIDPVRRQVVVRPTAHRRLVPRRDERRRRGGLPRQPLRHRDRAGRNPPDRPLRAGAHGRLRRQDHPGAAAGGDLRAARRDALRLRRPPAPRLPLLLGPRRARPLVGVRQRRGLRA